LKLFNKPNDYLCFLSSFNNNENLYISDDGFVDTPCANDCLPVVPERSFYSGGAAIQQLAKAAYDHRWE
jgi:hypothetical protein